MLYALYLLIIIVRIFSLSIYLVTVHPPIIMHHPIGHANVQLITNNFNFSLFCKAIGYQLSFEWTRNGSYISSDNYHKIKNDVNKSVLVILNATSFDAGEYQCVVTNSGGKVISRPSKLSFVGMYVHTYSYVSL